MEGRHGWVTPRPDAGKARCGGPAMCLQCADEARRAGFVTWMGHPLREPDPVDMRAQVARRDELLDQGVRLLRSVMMGGPWSGDPGSTRMAVDQWLSDVEKLRGPRGDP